LSISESSWIGKLEGTKVFPLFCMQTEQSVHNKQDSHEHHQRLLMPISGLPKNWYHMHILCQGMSHYYQCCWVTNLTFSLPHGRPLVMIALHWINIFSCSFCFGYIYFPFCRSTVEYYGLYT
jgi:hypothetical protein